MPKQLIYKLKIGAYNPDTIPMQRLSEYMSDLAKLLGEPQNVHFKDLEEGSTVLNAVIETEAIPKVSGRIKSLELGNASEEVQKTFDRLDARLALDNASGSLSAVGDDEQPLAVVLQFPGISRPKPIDFGIIKERGILDGIPVSITGRDSTKHVQLADGDAVHTGISLSTDLAIKIMDEQCVYRKVIRLHGEGRWSREDSGDWKLEGFKAESFEVLDPTPLRETLLQLRNVAGSGWSDMDDPIGFLRDLRDDPDMDESLH